VKQHIPNLFTLANLFIGNAAILLLFNGMTLWVLICAALCLIFDVLDGLTARNLNVSSKLGAQLDSLADMVSFGVLPACILAWLMMDCQDGLPLWAILPTFLITVATALRLAKFNLDDRDRAFFYGLPSPSSAAAIFALLLIIATDHQWTEYLSCNNVVFFGLVVLLPLLMLSNLRLWSFKGFSRPYGKVIFGILLSIFALLVIMTGSAALFLMVFVYVVFGLINKLVKVY
jgi:CDP-diacylglycerol---serine O-phosphatidyltransferase